MENDIAAQTATDDAANAAAATTAEHDLVIDELLVEEISVDGMCGVY
jgi:mycofactocin precursor